MHNALVLNASYEPLSVVSARRATCLVLSEKAEMLEDDGIVLHSERLELCATLCDQAAVHGEGAIRASQRCVAASDLRP